MKKRPSKSKTLSRGFRVVALGGGTGLSTLLRGLKEHVIRRTDEHASAERPIADLAAIVTVTDDGGSSGRLRRENRILPPGDIRNCMVALSKDEALLGRLFPSTLSNVHLVATLENGRIVHGETRITASRTPIKKLRLSPRQVRPLHTVLEAIKHADLILLGPGSLYTSILPNLLIPEIANAIAKSKAPRVYVANLMTQPGETSGYALADHLRAIQKHVAYRVIDCVVANRQLVSPDVARRYRAQGAEPVVIDLPDLQKLGFRVILDNLLEEHGVIRHNPKRLALLLLEEFLARPRHLRT